MNPYSKAAANPLTLSIITPSFNQADFLEATLHSVLGQGYPKLDYRVIDGGSTDDSREILRRYSDQLTYWCSEPDQGQYDAINKGFRHSSGDIMAWINSDDMYTPWAFQVVNEIFSTLPEVEWLTTLCPIVWGASGTPIYCAQRGGYTRQGFLRAKTCLLALGIAWGPFNKSLSFGDVLSGKGLGLNLIRPIPSLPTLSCGPDFSAR